MFIANLTRMAFLTLSFMAAFTFADEKMGPIGGTGGTPFQVPISYYERVCGMNVRADNWRVYGVQLKVCSNSGEARYSSYYGSQRGSLTTFDLSHNEEIRNFGFSKVTEDKRSRIIGLSIDTKDKLTGEKRWYSFGTIGIDLFDPRVGNDGSWYEFISLPEGYDVSGIFGRAGRELDAFGIYYRRSSGNELKGKNGQVRNVGGGGFSSSFSHSLRNSAPYYEVFCGVKVRHGSRIDAIQLEVCDAYGNRTWKTRRGGNGGTENYFGLASGEHFVAINVWIGHKSRSDRIFGLQFVTSNGRESPVYGRTTAMPAHLTIPDGYVIENITGAALYELDALGFIYELK